MSVRLTAEEIALLTGGATSSARLTYIETAILTSGVASSARLTYHAVAILASGVSFARLTSRLVAVLAPMPVVSTQAPRIPAFLG